MCYVKDSGRAIALLQTAGELNSSTYNVGSGYATKTKEVVDAIKRLVPDADLPLIDGRDPNSSPGRVPRHRPNPAGRRLPAHTYDIDRAIADYVGWLRSGNDR